MPSHAERAGVGGPGLQVGAHHQDPRADTREAWMGHLPREDADTEAAGVGAVSTGQGHAPQSWSMGRAQGPTSPE